MKNFFNNLNLNQVLVFTCVFGNFYSSYKQNERFEKLLVCVEKERAHLKEVLDIKFEKMDNNFHTLTEKASLAQIKLHDKVSSLHQNFSDYQVTLKSSLFQSKAENVYKINLFESFSSITYFQLFLFSCLSMTLILLLINSGFFSPFSYIKSLSLGLISPYYNFNHNIKDNSSQEKFDIVIKSLNNEKSLGDFTKTINNEISPIISDSVSKDPFIPNEHELNEIETMVRGWFN